MKSFFASVITGFAIAAGGGFQIQTPRPTTAPAPAEVTVRGCVMLGSAATVFLLDNAKKDPKSTTEKGLRYFVVPGTEDLMLSAHVNHLVDIRGPIVVKPAPAAGKPVTEQDLSTLTARSLTMVADTCRSTK